MSLTVHGWDENGEGFTAVGRQCFYCGEPLDDPAVFWMGHTGDMLLHPKCVGALFVRLARDVHETECPDYYEKLRR